MSADFRDEELLGILRLREHPWERTDRRWCGSSHHVVRPPPFDPIRLSPNRIEEWGTHATTLADKPPVPPIAVYTCGGSDDARETMNQPAAMDTARQATPKSVLARQR